MSDGGAVAELKKKLDLKVDADDAIEEILRWESNLREWDAAKSAWVANHQLETSKFTFKFPGARNLEIRGLVLGGGGGGRPDYLQRMAVSKPNVASKYYSVWEGSKRFSARATHR